ncbi:MAG: hypothetical protein PHQ30_04140 [Candidatus Izemoplasmatales bacterium]|jgi:hypothetical protein|nr:hypothetical protein [Candidatus Izemoplasmatales bacterium]
MDNDIIEYIKTKFLEVADIRKKNLIVTSVKSLDDFIKDFKILIEYSNLSKGYIYTLFEIIISKIGAENDYKFLDYIHKYKGEL